MESSSILRSLAALWGALGVTTFLGYAIYRLSMHMLTALEYELSAVQWLVLIVNMIFMAYSEGYKGFLVKRTVGATFLPGIFWYNTAPSAKCATFNSNDHCVGNDCE